MTGFCGLDMGLLVAQLTELLPLTQFRAVLTDDTLRGALALLAGWARSATGRQIHALGDA